MAGLPIPNPIPGAPLLDPLGEQIDPVTGIAPAPPTGLPALQLPDVDPLTGLPVALNQEPQGYQFDAAGEPLKFPPDDWFASATGEVPPTFEGHGAPAAEPDNLPVPTTALEQQAPQGEQAAPAPVQRPSTGDPYLDAIGDSADLRARAAVGQAEAEKQKNLYLSQQGVQLAQDQSAHQAAADKEYEEVSREAKAKRAELDAEAIAIGNTKTDPNRAWNNLSGGAQAFMVIASALTGMQHPGGPNPVVDAYTKAVDRDLDAQAKDLENRRGALGVRRGLLADDLAAGRDMLDIRYKSLNAAAETAKNQVQAYAMRFDNPVIDARAMTTLADINEHQAMVGNEYQRAKEKQIYQERQDRISNGIAGGHLRLAQRKQAIDEWDREHPQEHAMSPRDQLQRDKDNRARIIRGSSGNVIGQADEEHGAGAANKIVDNQARGAALYKQGKELFKDGRADNPASKLYRDQKAFDTSWVNYTKSADGDFSAPNDADFKGRGLFGDFKDMNPQAALEQGYKQARAQGAAVLRKFVSQEDLYKEGFVDPEDDPAFKKGGAPKQVAPDLRGLPNAAGVYPDEGPPQALTPDEEAFVKSGRFTPTAPAQQDLLDYTDDEEP